MVPNMNIFKKKKKTLCLWHIKFSHVTRQFHSKDSRVPVTSPEDCLVDNLQKKYRRRLSSCIISFIFYYYKLLYLSTSLQTSWFFQWFRMKDTFAFPTNCRVRISLLGSMIFTRFVTWLFFLFFFANVLVYFINLTVRFIQYVELTWSQKINKKNTVLKLFCSRRRIHFFEINRGVWKYSCLQLIVHRNY